MTFADEMCSLLNTLYIYIYIYQRKCRNLPVCLAREVSWVDCLMRDTR